MLLQEAMDSPEITRKVIQEETMKHYNYHHHHRRSEKNALSTGLLNVN